MENEGKKSREKMMFLVVWLRVEKRRDFGETHATSFLSSPSKTQSLQIGEKMKVKSGQNCPHFLFTFFFFGQLQPGRNKCGLPTIFFFSIFFFFWVSLDSGYLFILNMMMGMNP